MIHILYQTYTDDLGMCFLLNSFLNCKDVKIYDNT